MDKTPFYFDQETPIRLTDVQLISHNIGDFMSYGWMQGTSDLNDLSNIIPHVDDRFEECEFTFNEIIHHIEHRLNSTDGIISMVWLSNFFRHGAVFLLNASENTMISIAPNDYTHYCINQILAEIDVTADDDINVQNDMENILYNVVATASFNVASILREGIGVERDLERSIKYYKKAASLGEANASYILGVLSHQDGDLEQAHSCFLTAAHLGHLDSQVNVAANYLYGEIVSQNNELAYYWAKIASNQGDAESRKIISTAEKSLNRKQIERLDEAVLSF
jgi:hypothetical protein